ncbi:hypothetical protein K4L44_07280 [Halosquirtibacter laminarini]|uniref:Uncharacterized protein n=1 Tax=Halosquirtibacter laminarini TaxID=3374600 RepID=A0AC61NIU1_9BACT|nr:hypothetical protein K4L44_07280 [Prolixibacteraceae bacterium]
MRNIILFCLTFGIIMIFSDNVFSEEISLSDVDGEAVAYIDTEKENTVFLWDGTPEAYLIKEKNWYNVYGFNGLHLGWYEKGLVYTHKGYVIGFKKGCMNIKVSLNEEKSRVDYLPFKHPKEKVPEKPKFIKQITYSECLGYFLRMGRD